MIRARQERGLTLVEVLVSMVLLSILLIPAIQAIQAGVAGAEVHADVATSHHRIASRLEELLTEPFTDLADDGLDGVFDDDEDADRIVAIILEINSRVAS